MKRDYKKEYEYHSKPAQKKNRAARNKARRAAEAAGKVKKGDGKDVGHKKALKKGGSKSIKNTKVQSRSSNRSHGGKTGSKAKKAAGGRKSKR
jgi:hypothetical protein